MTDYATWREGGRGEGEEREGGEGRGGRRVGGREAMEGVGG